MKAYGLPRNNDIESPDVGDIKAYALKSSTGRYDYRGYIKNKAAKRATRRIYKRAARRDGDASCHEDNWETEVPVNDNSIAMEIASA